MANPRHKSVRVKHLLESSRMPRESLPTNIEAEDGKSGILFSTVRIGPYVTVQTDQKGWGFLFEK